MNYQDNFKKNNKQNITVRQKREKKRRNPFVKGKKILRNSFNISKEINGIFTILEFWPMREIFLLIFTLAMFKLENSPLKIKLSIFISFKNPFGLTILKNELFTTTILLLNEVMLAIDSTSE